MSQSELEARAYPTRCLHFLQSRRWETLGELEAQEEEHSGFKFMKVPLAPLWGVRKAVRNLLEGCRQERRVWTREKGKEKKDAFGIYLEDGIV